MKTKLLFSVSFIGLYLFLNGVTAQQSTYSKVYFDLQNFGIQANSLVKTQDEGYLIAGRGIFSNGFLMKIDSAGNESWNKSYTLSTNNGFTKIITAKDTNFYLVGSNYSTLTSTNNVFYTKITPFGDTLWSGSINFGAFSSEALNAEATNDSGLVLTGYLAQNTAPYFKIIVCKIDQHGALQWSKILASGNNSNIGSSIKQTVDSGYIVTGYVENFPPFEANSFLLKLNKQGVISWAKKYNKGVNSICSGNDVVVTNTGYLNYLNAGNFADIMKTDLSGNIISVKTISQFVNQGCSNCVTPRLNKTNDGGFFTISGNMEFGGITKMDSSAQVQWEQGLFFISMDGAQAADKGYFLIGNGPVFGIRTAAPASPQIGIIKTDSVGGQSPCSSQTSINFNQADTLATYSMSLTNISGGASSEFHPLYTSLTLLHDSGGCVTFISGVEEFSKNNLITVYPNPSNGNFTIELVSETEQASIQVLNLIGENIFETVLKAQEKGQFQLNALAPGMYFIKVNSGNSQQLKKISIQ